MFDTVKMIDAYMSLDVWLECHRALTRVLEKLTDSPHLKLGPIRIDDLATQAMANQGMNKGKETARLTAEAAAKAEAASGGGESKGESKGEDDDDIIGKCFRKCCLNYTMKYLYSSLLLHIFTSSWNSCSTILENTCSKIFVFD